MSETLSSIPFSSAFPTHFSGPPLEEGPLPSLFYFSLSSEESLTLPPFDQPVAFLRNQKMRLFSISLPGHSPSVDPNEAMVKWREKAAAGENPIQEWLEDAQKTLSHLLEMGLVRKNEIALAGLSRGAFCALHLAALLDFSLPIVCYAPLLHLSEAFPVREFISKLSKHRFFFSIGNRDVRVGTETTFSLVTELSEQMFLEGKRSPPVELHITPSIGFKGHGTSKENFELGSSWAAKEVGVTIDETV